MGFIGHPDEIEEIDIVPYEAPVEIPAAPEPVPATPERELVPA